MSEEELVRDLTLKQLKGWAGALVDAIDKHTPELLNGEKSTNPKDLEIPRDKVRRLVRQIGEIGVTVEEEVFVEPAVIVR